LLSRTGSLRYPSPLPSPKAPATGLLRIGISGSVASAVAKFAVTGAIALAIVGVAQGFLMRRVSTSEAVNNARNVTEVIGHGLIEPTLSDGLVSGDPQALVAVDAAVRQHLLKDPVVRVKIWSQDGHILYSDESRLIGAVYPLGDDDLAVFKDGKSAANLSDLSAPENQFERSEKKLLQVYMPLHTPSGLPVLFEAYLRFASVDKNGHRVWIAFIPIMLVGLVALELAQLPLAWSMGSRIWRTQREREVLLRGAIEASDVERRRIASGLHDSVVQDLAGLSYSLAGAADSLGPNASPEVKAVLQRAAAGARESMRELRKLLVDIYPPNVHESGLEAALSDLLQPLSAKGIGTSLQFPTGLTLTPETEGLLFRASRETIHNITKHAEATHVDERVMVEGNRVVLVIEDNGKGFSTDELETKRADGHVGLRLLSDILFHAGGRLAVDSHPGNGTFVRVEVPL
jgi:signal transduction histidine kinase